MCGGPAPVEVGLLWQVVVRIVVVEVLYIGEGTTRKYKGDPMLTIIIFVEMLSKYDIIFTEAC